MAALSSLFDFRDDYRDYLTWVLAQRSGKSRGLKSKLAATLGCQSGFLSQVLGKHGHFNLEHGEKVNAFLEHTAEEAHYFLLLIQRTRAGTKSLQSYFDSQLGEILEKRLVLRHRVKIDQALTLEEQTRYYSSWYYGATRVLLTIPEFRSKEKIAKRLGLPLAKISSVLEFLVNAGLAEEKNGVFEPTNIRLHLGNDSALIAKHHINWRNRSLVSFDFERATDLHYSSVVSLAKKDAVKLKELTIEFIEKVKALVRESPAEELYSFNLDFFEP